MKILFDNITVLFENGVADTELYLSVTDKTISYVGKTRPDGIFDRVIDGTESFCARDFITVIPMRR